MEKLEKLIEELKNFNPVEYVSRSEVIRGLEEAKAEIIELPIKKDYPKVMWVWNDESEKLKRVVFMEKCGKYVAWAFAETLEDAEYETKAIDWKFAQDIEEPKQITIQEAEKILNDLGNNVKIV